MQIAIGDFAKISYLSLLFLGVSFQVHFSFVMFSTALFTICFALDSYQNFSTPIFNYMAFSNNSKVSAIEKNN